MNIATLFSEEPMRSNPANHCVPILDVFGDDADPNISYLVMPLLRDIDNPPFESVADVMHFADQMLEVMHFVDIRPELSLTCGPRASYTCMSTGLPIGGWVSLVHSAKY